MTELTIQRVFEKYGTDKARHTNYSCVYAEIFDTFTPKRILELGVWKGQSLLAWAELFPEAEIVGVDKHYPDNDIKNAQFVQGDLTKLPFDVVDPESKGFDLIIDDASHELDQQIAALRYLDVLRSGGVMVIEDVYWKVANLLSAEIHIKYKVTRYDLRGIADEYLIVIR